jgi:O-antigen/teichoic acid export membrane protein
VAWNAIARWASQILSWISTIVVARLLTPYDYGLIGMAGLYISLAMMLNESGITQTIIALRDLTPRQVAELNSVSVFLGAGLFGLSCVVALPLARFFAAPPLLSVVIVYGMTFLTSAFQIVPKAVLQKELRFKLLAFIETIRAFSQIILTVTLAWRGYRYWSLVVGSIVGSFTVTALILCWKRVEFAFPRFAQLRRELKFGGQVLLSSLAWYAYDNADFGVAGRVLGSAELGNYTVAWTISSAPVEKVTNLVTSVTPAFFSAIQKDPAELRRYLLGLTEVLSYLTVPAAIGLALVADYLVPVLLGPKWLGVVGPLRLLGILFAARSLSTIFPNLLTAVGEAAFVMKTTVGAAIVMPAAFYVGSRWGTTGIAATWVVAYPLVMAPMFYRVLQRTETKLKEYIVAILPALSGSAGIVSAVLLVRLILLSGAPSVSGFVTLLVVGVVSYVSVLYAFHRDRVIRLRRALTVFQGRKASTELQTI